MPVMPVPNLNTAVPVPEPEPVPEPAESDLPLLGLRYTVSAGDVVLFSRSCGGFLFAKGKGKSDLLSSAICFGAKASSLSEYDHVGIVVQNPDDKDNNTLYLLEANVNGISLFKLCERLKRTNATKIAIRKVVSLNETPEERTARLEKLWGLAKGHTTGATRYNPSFYDMTNALVASYTDHMFDIKNKGNVSLHASVISERQSGSRYNPKSKLLKAMLRDAAKHIGVKVTTHLPSLDENSESKESPTCTSTSTSTSTGAGAQLPHSDRKYYCSHLVAQLLMETNVISSTCNREPKSFIPADFSSTAHLQGLSRAMTSGFALSPNLIVYNPRKAQYYEQAGQFTIHSNCSRSSTTTFNFSAGDVLPPDITQQMQINSQSQLTIASPSALYWCPFEKRHRNGNPSVEVYTKLSGSHEVEVLDVVSQHDTWPLSVWTASGSDADGRPARMYWKALSAVAMVYSMKSRTESTNLNDCPHNPHFAVSAKWPAVYALLNVLRQQQPMSLPAQPELSPLRGSLQSLRENTVLDRSVLHQNLVVLLKGTCKTENRVISCSLGRAPQLINPKLLIGDDSQSPELTFDAGCELLLINRLALIEAGFALPPVCWKWAFNQNSSIGELLKANKLMAFMFAQKDSRGLVESIDLATLCLLESIYTYGSSNDVDSFSVCIDDHIRQTIKKVIESNGKIEISRDGDNRDNNETRLAMMCIVASTTSLFEGIRNRDPGRPTGKRTGDTATNAHACRVIKLAVAACSCRSQASTLIAIQYRLLLSRFSLLRYLL